MVSAPAQSEADLVARSRAGDPRAFEELVRRHQERVFNTVYRMVGGYDDAAEVTQEAFLNAFRGLRRFRGGAGFGTWLYRVAINAAYSHLRKRAARLRPASLEAAAGDDQLRRQPAAEQDGPAEAAARREEARLVQQALLELDLAEREVIVLRDVEGLDYARIAEVLECPVGTVKSRLHRARDALRALVRPRLNAE